VNIYSNWQWISKENERRHAELPTCLSLAVQMINKIDLVNTACLCAVKANSLITEYLKLSFVEFSISHRKFILDNVDTNIMIFYYESIDFSVSVLFCYSYYENFEYIIYRRKILKCNTNSVKNTYMYNCSHCTKFKIFKNIYCLVTTVISKK